MSLPVFFQQEIFDNPSLSLNEDTSKHIIQVLRMKQGEQLKLTDGKGKSITAGIISENKKTAEVKVISTSIIPHHTSKIAIAISLVKNNARFEWFLEKATEIGVSEIIPLICERTEKQNFRYDRMNNIIISAMLQSQQSWLPTLHEPTKFNDLIKTESYQKKYIAHCDEQEKVSLHQHNLSQPFRISESAHQLICIGPEGDFTKNEIASAKQNNFIAVSLGETRLRTETAGIVACVLLKKFIGI